MNPVKPKILAINGGSSSIRFALYEAGEELISVLQGKISGIAQAKTKMTFTNAGESEMSLDMEAPSHSSAANFLVNWLKKQNNFSEVESVGHRVVHGMKHTHPELITEELLNELQQISSIDPDHLPDEIELIKNFSNVLSRHTALRLFRYLPFTAPCRAWRAYFPFLAALMNKACSDMASTEFHVLI